MYVYTHLHFVSQEANLSPVPSWWIWSLAPWILCAQARLDNSSGQIILYLVCVFECHVWYTLDLGMLHSFCAALSGFGPLAVCQCEVTQLNAACVRLKLDGNWEFVTASLYHKTTFTFTNVCIYISTRFKWTFFKIFPFVLYRRMLKNENGHWDLSTKIWFSKH